MVSILPSFGGIYKKTVTAASRRPPPAQALWKNGQPVRRLRYPQSLHAVQTGGSCLHSHSQRPVDNCDTRQKERCRVRAPCPSHEIRQDECGRLSRSP